MKRWAEMNKNERIDNLGQVLLSLAPYTGQGNADEQLSRWNATEVLNHLKELGALHD